MPHARARTHGHVIAGQAARRQGESPPRPLPRGKSVAARARMPRRPDALPPRALSIDERSFCFHVGSGRVTHIRHLTRRGSSSRSAHGNINKLQRARCAGCTGHCTCSWRRCPTWPAARSWTGPTPPSRPTTCTHALAHVRASACLLEVGISACVRSCVLCTAQVAARVGLCSPHHVTGIRLQCRGECRSRLARRC
jgi:hypothetical protein